MIMAQQCRLTAAGQMGEDGQAALARDRYVHLSGQFSLADYVEVERTTFKRASADRLGAQSRRKP
jgi:hypothetical protein